MLPRFIESVDNIFGSAMAASLASSARELSGPAWIAPASRCCRRYVRHSSRSKLGKANAVRLTEKSESLSSEAADERLEASLNSDLQSTTAARSSRWEDMIVQAEQRFNFFITGASIGVLDRLYHKRDYARFYVLETIARVPYFAFVSVLHMYESFGWWRRADYLKVHFAESWNELHHLLVMEALGGDERWFDRFLAQHIAVAYYFLTSLMYTISPRMAYHFSECVERHAHSTYDKFIKEHGEELKQLPAPKVAVDYYTKGDLYMFDEFQTHRPPDSRRPKVDNLYDVFVNIREDEWEHCKTMHACQLRGNLRSPHDMKEDDEPPPAECNGILECATTATSYAKRASKSRKL